MENPRVLKTILTSSIFKAACVGALLFGGVTLAVDYYNYYYGPKSGHGSWGMLFTILLAIPGQALIETTGVGDTKLFHYLYNTIGGFAIAAIVNAFLGAILFGAIACFRRLCLNAIRNDGHD